MRSCLRSRDGVPFYSRAISAGCIANLFRIARWLYMIMTHACWFVRDHIVFCSLAVMPGGYLQGYRAALHGLRQRSGGGFPVSLPTGGVWGKGEGSAKERVLVLEQGTREGGSGGYVCDLAEL